MTFLIASLYTYLIVTVQVAMDMCMTLRLYVFIHSIKGLGLCT